MTEQQAKLLKSRLRGGTEMTVAAAINAAKDAYDHFGPFDAVITAGKRQHPVTVGQGLRAMISRLENLGAHGFGKVTISATIAD